VKVLFTIWALLLPKKPWARMCSLWPSKVDTYKIVGVVEDYHHEAIKKDIYPTIFFLNHNIGQQVYYSIRLNEKVYTREVVEYIEKSWKEIFPEKQFEYFFPGRIL
jgi:putative ABC transport system permease protein